MKTRIMVVAVLLFLAPSRVSAGPPCPADLNGDGEVGPADLAMLLASWGPCPAGPTDCCYPHFPESGCEDPICESLVCAADPFCCNTAWDELCAIGAAGLCPECFGIDCCFDHSGTGIVECTDPVCEETICSVFPDCCNLVWDGFCAALAEMFCPQCFP